MNKILVKAEVFDFYRREYGLTVDELAEKSGYKSSDLQYWCKNDSQISVSVLRKLSNVYKKHWGIFLINSETEHFKKPKDFRGRNSSKLGLEAMLAFEEASRLIEISREQFGKSPAESITRLQTYKNDIPLLASKCREVLKVSSDIQKGWHKPEEAYIFLREAMESKGLVISEQSIENQELDGFVIQTTNGAAIVINKLDKNVYRRMFTLLHELGHFIQGISASCEVTEGSTISTSISDESFADTFASNFFLPKSQMDTDSLVKKIRSSGVVADSDYQTLSKRYSVSMSAVAVWFCNEKLITRDERDSKIDDFSSMYRENREKQLAKNKEKGGFDPKGHERKAMERVGRNLTKDIIGSYHEGKSSVRDVAATLNVSVGMVERIDTLISNGHT